VRANLQAEALWTHADIQVKHPPMLIIPVFWSFETNLPFRSWKTSVAYVLEIIFVVVLIQGIYCVICMLLHRRPNKL